MPVQTPISLSPQIVSVIRLTAVFGALAAVGAAFASLLTYEATAQTC